jgi:hypothetical protein
MGILDKIFSWSGWDDITDDFEIYYDCELLIDVGEYQKGSEFNNIQFDKNRLFLYFYKSAGDNQTSMIKRFVLEN